MIFELNEKEVELYKKWREEHEKTCEWLSGKKDAGAIGGVLSIVFVMTSIGNMPKVYCTCGEKESIADWGSY